MGREADRYIGNTEVEEQGRCRPSGLSRSLHLNLSSLGATEKATEAGDEVFLALVTGVVLSLEEAWNLA
jgi:hypothetical protein